MPVNGQIKTLYTDEAKQNAIFPLTSIDAVTDSEGNSVKDLIDRKQDIIDSSNKLNADLLSEGSTNKLVSQSEKNAWSGKQDAITNSNKLSSDLVSDSNATNKFVTAGDKITWSNKQNAITSSSKLSADLIDDSNATNKFVTAGNKTTWNNKQDALIGTQIEGQNIKTINNGTILGSGNISVVVPDNIPYATSSTVGGVKVQYDSSTQTLNIITE